MLAKCDAGCGNTFTVRAFDVERLGSGIERTQFTCPHCRHDYTCFYTNAEIRSLQHKIRSQAGENRNVEKLQIQNKVKMIELRTRMEVIR